MSTWMPARLAGLVLTVLWLGSASAAAQDPDQGDVLAVDPAGLPVDEAGAWQGFFDPAGFEERLAALAPALRGHLEAAETAYRQADYPRVVARAHDALRTAPDCPPAWLILGTTYFRLQRYSDARTAFERFLSVAPTEAWRTQALAHSYYSLGDYAAARAHYELILERVPENPEARRGLALTHWREGDDAAARRLLDRLARECARHFETRLWAGRVAFDSGDLDAALPHARAATELAGHDPRGWFLLLECLWEAGAEEEARGVEFVWRERDAIAQERRRIGAELRLRPRDWPRLTRAVELAARVEDVAAVQELLPRLLRARPDDVEDLAVRLYALETLERLDALEAARAVARGVEQKAGDDRDAWAALEAFYGRIGDNAAAARAGERRRRLGG